MKKYNYELFKIDESTWQIEDDIVRAFLLVGEERALLIDSTNGSGELFALVRELTERPVCLINTHADADHIGCSAQFSECLMHPAEYAFYARMKGEGDPEPRPVWDGEVLDLGKRSVEVIHTPGHTPGSIALLDREWRTLYSGDSVSSTPVFIFGGIRSLPALVESLRRLRARRDEFDRIHASHGELPLPPERIDEQIECAMRLLAGELEPSPPPFEVPAQLYIWGGASFLYNGGE